MQLAIPLLRGGCGIPLGFGIGWISCGGLDPQSLRNENSNRSKFQNEWLIYFLFFMNFRIAYCPPSWSAHLLFIEERKRSAEGRIAPQPNNSY